MTYRLFLSHVSSDGAYVDGVGHFLRDQGIRPFVAPRNIRWSSEWIREVEEALLTSHALVAFLREGFRLSPWTDQEVGYALGRKRKVLPLRFDSVQPHGFLNRYQALDIAELRAHEVAITIFDALYDDLEEQERLKDTVISRVVTERDYHILRTWTHRLGRTTNVSTKQLSMIRAALKDNSVLAANRPLKIGVEESLQRLSVNMEK